MITFIYQCIRIRGKILDIERIRNTHLRGTLNRTFLGNRNVCKPRKDRCCIYSILHEVDSKFYLVYSKALQYLEFHFATITLNMDDQTA